MNFFVLLIEKNTESKLRKGDNATFVGDFKE